MTLKKKRKVESLYPPIEPYRTGYLSVDANHRVYFEESGNPKGKPAVFLHGGPGAGTEPRMRRFFNPKKYRIVLFDQRGCGRSRPHGSLRHNTTWHLVRDIEALRTRLMIERWLVFGGSWGSTLALAYAQKHPHRVTELVLRGIFLARKSDIDWFYQSLDGTAALYPDQWEAFAAPIPMVERRNMVRAYYKRLTSSNNKTVTRAALAWSIWRPRRANCAPMPRKSLSGVDLAKRSPRRALVVITSSMEGSLAGIASFSKMYHVSGVFQELSSTVGMMSSVQCEALGICTSPGRRLS